VCLCAKSCFRVLILLLPYFSAGDTRVAIFVSSSLLCAPCVHVLFHSSLPFLSCEATDVCSLSCFHLNILPELDRFASLNCSPLLDGKHVPHFMLFLTKRLTHSQFGAVLGLVFGLPCASVVLFRRVLFLKQIARWQSQPSSHLREGRKDRGES